MTKISLLCMVLAVICFSCNSKKDSETPTAKVSALEVDFQEATLSNSADSMDLTKILRLTKAQYDSLQLNKVEELEGYHAHDLTMGNTLLQNENGKILAIRVITDGEITDFLLSYDNDGNLVDNLLVAYEDMVEYYSEVSSHINSDKITVQTVNFSYDDIGGYSIESSDTAIAKYQITPGFKFVNE